MDDVRFYGELALVREGIEKIHEALPDYKYIPMRDVREAMYPEKMTTEPVSYTHLDVYKRQVVELLNFSIQMPISRSKALRRRIIPMISLTWQSEMCHSVHIRSMTVSMTATIL